MPQTFLITFFNLIKVQFRLRTVNQKSFCHIFTYVFEMYNFYFFLSKEKIVLFLSMTLFSHLSNVRPSTLGSTGSFFKRFFYTYLYSNIQVPLQTTINQQEIISTSTVIYNTVTNCSYYSVCFSKMSNSTKIFFLTKAVIYYKNRTVRTKRLSKQKFK